VTLQTDVHRARWDARYAGKDLVWTAGPNELFASEVAGLPPGKALDVACGEGRNALWLAQQGWQVTGIDFSSVGIEKAQRISRARHLEVEWLVADVCTHPLPQLHFDLVAVLYLHTSAQLRKQWLANVAASVKPGGTFVYIGHDPSNIEHGYGGPQDPELLPDAQSLVANLAGFDILFAGVKERGVEGESGHGKPEDESGAIGSGTQTLVALDTYVRAVRR
jgi:SAM-dependent methyltransferase